MTKAQHASTEKDRLQAENTRLVLENEQLRRQLAATPPPAIRSQPLLHHRWRALSSGLLAALAIALLVVGSLLFWMGNTLVKPDRFAATTAPIIKQPAVQQAAAAYTTQALFANVDVNRAVTQALPPRADFLAPTIASQLRGYTQKTLQVVLARPQFQARWNNLLAGAQARFISSVKQGGSDGTIDINELYRQLGDSLQGTKLSFLAGHTLPAQVGSVQVVSGSGIVVLHRVITHIDLWRWLAIMLLVGCAAGCLYLSQSRRRAVVRLSLGGAFGLFALLVALRISREAAADQVKPAYAQAVRDSMQAVFHPLVVQTATLLCLLLLVALIAWVTGASRAAAYIQNRVRLLFAGKLHGALFGERENAFTWWIGRHKRPLEWGLLVVMAVLLLLTQLTPAALVAYLVMTVVLVLLIELLAAPQAPPEPLSIHRAP